MNVAIIQTGTANIASVRVAFERLGVCPRLVSDPRQISNNEALVLPGVGSFAAGMKALRDNNWIDVLRERVTQDQPLLSICLGLQMLCTESDEAPGVEGLRILPAAVRKLPGTVSLPHFGWNTITSDSPTLPSGFVYYANSFGVTELDAIQQAGWSIATTTYGTTFVAAVRKASILACQFHPELSGAFGSQLISDWLTRAKKRIDEQRGVSC